MDSIVINSIITARGTQYAVGLGNVEKIGYSEGDSAACYTVCLKSGTRIDVFVYYTDTNRERRGSSKEYKKGSNEHSN